MDESRNESSDTRAKMQTENLFLSLKNSIFSKKKTVADKNAWKYPCTAIMALKTSGHWTLALMVSKDILDCINLQTRDLLFLKIVHIIECCTISRVYFD